VRSDLLVRSEYQADIYHRPWWVRGHRAPYLGQD